MDPNITTKVAETAAGHFTWIHMVYVAIVAGLTGGFFNPVLKFLASWYKKRWGKKEKDHKSDTVHIAEIKKEEHTEDKLWARIESLESKFNEEVDKRLKSEESKNKLQFQVDELRTQVDDLKRERLFNLSRYIHLKLRIGEAKKEIDYLKSKLMEKDPNFDKDYPNFTVVSEALSDEDLIDQIVNEKLIKETI